MNITSLSVGINSHLDVKINFDLISKDEIITVISNNNKLIVVPSFKGGHFSFHSESKFSDQISKTSSSIIFGISDFDDKSVFDIKLDLSNVSNSPFLHFYLNSSSVGISFGSDSD